MLILGIESTCDETAAAVVASGSQIYSNIVYSQSDLHQDLGGAIPELACRRHMDIIIPVITEALKKASCTLKDIDLIAAAKGPGFMGALLIGLNVAKTLSLALKVPFLGVNHLEAHLYAAMMVEMPKKFPCLGIIISGGHTALVHIEAIGSYRLLGSTVDDAIGEAFDKVASLLGLAYPGGPFIENLAVEGDPYRYSFSSGRVKNHPLHFSFSGLKTNVLYSIKGQNQENPPPLTEKDRRDIAASFQRAAFSDIVNKTLLAMDREKYYGLVIGGGVSANQTLKKMFKEAITSIPQFWPTKILASDNAAMIAGLAYHQYLAKPQGDSYALKAMPRIPNLI